MSEANFRVKLNLSKFYQDVRRYSWIFIDGARISRICHVKDHIGRMFNIAGPFHLLINETDYLPPNEDVRILKPNETVMVVPGSGLEADREPERKMVSSRVQNNCGGSVKEIVTLRNRASQASHLSELKVEPNGFNQQEVSSTPLNGSLTNERSNSIATEENEFDDQNEMKVENHASDDICIGDNMMPRKKKRMRTRRSKSKKYDDTENYMNNNDYRPKKPKVIDSQIITSGKHTRFEFTEDGMNTSDLNGTDSSTVADVSTVKSSDGQPLESLVALRRHNPPLTFTKEGIKNEVKVESVWDETANVTSTPASPEDSERGPPPAKNKDILELETDHGKIEVNTNYEGRPIMTSKPVNKDFIAFKMLKIGPDLTPQTTEFIVAQVISIDTNDDTYSLKILEGIEEVQIPEEDYIPEDANCEPGRCQASIRLKYTNILAPRLLHYDEP